MAEDILPPNATAAEKAIDGAGARAVALPLNIPLLIQPFAVPSGHLPWLALGLSVDLWREDWDEEKKRVQVARSLPFHRIKGTQAGIAEAVAAMRAKALKFTVPPAATFMTKALAPDERAAYLARFAQLRLFPYVARAIHAGHSAYPGAGLGAYLGERVAGPENPVSTAGLRYTRTARLWDQGAETTLTIRTVEPEHAGGGQAVAYDEVILGPKPTAAIHLNAPPKAKPMLIDDQGVRQRIVRVPRAEGYSYRLGRERYTTHWPNADLIDVRPQEIAEAHAALSGAVFPGGAGQRIAGGHLPGTISWRHLFKRWHIHDPERTPDRRKRGTHLGFTRLGMPPYHAEVLTRIEGRRYPRAAGAFVGGFVVAASQQPLADAREAIRVSMALRDKVLINTKTHRRARVGDRLPLGSTKIGEYIEV